MDIRTIQNLVYQNKVNHGFNLTDVNMEFCLTYGELGEAYQAWLKKHDNVGEEIADVVIYLMGLSEILGIDLQKEIEDTGKIIEAIYIKNKITIINNLPNTLPKYKFMPSFIVILYKTGFI